MNRDPLLKVVTIQKGLNIPTLKKCIDCCQPPKYHCPFCSPSYFKPSKYSRTKLHLDIHMRRAIYVGEYTIHRCALECTYGMHFHCLYCPAILISTTEFTHHLQQEDHAKWRAQISYSTMTHTVQSKGSPTAGEGDIHSDDQESNNNDGGDVTIVSDSESQGASGDISSSQLQANAEKPQDCDEFYFMSLAKMFKKLSAQQKEDVRLKIERLLFEAEFQ